mgnify:FL=1
MRLIRSSRRKSSWRAPAKNINHFLFRTAPGGYFTRDIIKIAYDVTCIWTPSLGGYPRGNQHAAVIMVSKTHLLTCGNSEAVAISLANFQLVS